MARLLRGAELREHASPAQIRRPRVLSRLLGRGQVCDHGHQPGILVGPRIAVEQTVHVAQDHQQVHLHQRGHQRGQLVVVAELHLVHRHRIVLVDDGNDVPVQQRLERVLGVEVALAVGQVLVGQQHLRHLLLVAGEGVLVKRHETDLADGRQRLFLGQVRGAFGQPQPAHARRDGAGADDHELLSLVVQSGKLAHQASDTTRVQAALGGQDATPDLDHHPFRRANVFASQVSHETPRPLRVPRRPRPARSAPRGRPPAWL